MESLLGARPCSFPGWFSGSESQLLVSSSNSLNTRTRVGGKGQGQRSAALGYHPSLDMGPPHPRAAEMGDPALLPPAGGWHLSAGPSAGSSTSWRRGTTLAGTPGPTVTTATASCPSDPCTL